MDGPGYPLLTVTWTAGHGPGLGTRDGADDLEGERILRNFASKIRAIPEIDGPTETTVQFGPPGPDEAPRMVGSVEIFFDDPPTVLMQPLPGYRRSEMADLAADVMAGFRKHRLATGMGGWG